MTKRHFQKQKDNALEDICRIGWCYESGDGVGKDEVQAVKWYLMAAEQGFPKAMFELCKCYTLGIGVRRNSATASKWLHNAAERGYTRAMCMLGKNYQNEFRAEHNPVEAVKWFRKAAEAGDAWGMFHLGECYETGNGVKKDFDAAYLWFCKAVTTAPENERLYQFVQNQIFDPNLKECREQILGESVNGGKLH